MSITRHLTEQDAILLSLLENCEGVTIELGPPNGGAIVTSTRVRGQFDVAVFDHVARQYVEAEGVTGIREALQLALTEDLKSVKEIVAQRDEERRQAQDRRFGFTEFTEGQS